MTLPRSHARRRTFARLGAGAVAAAAATSLVALAAPAYAEEPGADLKLSIAGEKVVKEGGKPFFIRLYNDGPATARGIKVTIDASRLNPDKVDFTLPTPVDGCDVKDAVAVCSLPDLAPGGHDNGFAALLIGGIKFSGVAGSFDVSVEAETPDPNPANNKKVTTKVDVVRQGVDLVAQAQDIYANLETTSPVKPGETAPLAWFLQNLGNKSVKGVAYTLTLPSYLTFVNKRVGCQYDEAMTVARCSFPNRVLKPGQMITGNNVTGINLVKLAKNAPGPGAITGGMISGRALGEIAATDEPSLDKRSAEDDGLKILSAEEAAAVKTRAEKKTTNKDIDKTDNTAPFSVFTAANPADLEVTAKEVKGRVGDTVDAALTVTNHGPADAHSTTVTVTAPGGTEIVGAAKECKAVTAGKEYTCPLGIAPAGRSGTGTFKLKITSATVTDGKATIASVIADPNEKNNTTAIKVTILPAGLPVTGSQTAVVVFLGLGAVVLGGVLFLFARRRRVVMVSPTE